MISRERAEKLKIQLADSVAVLSGRLASINKQSDRVRYWNTKTALSAAQKKLDKLLKVIP